jgi:hypothetical protein
MIKILTAHTFEVDDFRLAAAEILERLDLERSLLKNSAGFIFCSLDFVKSGAAEAVAQALPFEVIGCTTMGIALPEASGEIMLAAAVLTSDEVLFTAGVSDPLGNDEEGRITELYRRLSAPLESPPARIFVTHPGLPVIAGDRVIAVFDRLSGWAPLFGAVALDEAVGSRSPMTIYNGAAYSDRIALLLVSAGESRFAPNPSWRRISAAGRRWLPAPGRTG